ncbi:GH3 auxin-responsive promoter family protein [Bdellovibrio sp. HCB185ZH]|uniref:GH3 family domain-containing protein n=1 Tax=Bdellovibrio sp. HCB185ZH TaxID=3394235 RepID=UPI0039A5C20A
MSFLKYAFYPLTIVLSFAFFALTASFIPSLPVRTLLSVAFGSSLIWVAEYWMPFKKEWVGFDKQAKLDGMYLFGVHAFLGRLVEAGALAFIIYLQQQGIFPTGALWPNEWPLIPQVICLIFLSEFFRYWLHRACHEIPFMWSIHAVHHSPLKLYWWNVGRFHPIEKVSQLCFESILFLFLGVSPLAMSVYFIFYSVNGFFQHCNIDIKLGWLNRIISGPELHRYHHSYEIHESNNNYGNKTSIYDQVFGTYYLPDLKGPARYGLQNPNYPQNFIDQMRAPFIKGLDKKGFIRRPALLQNFFQALIRFSVHHRGSKLQKLYFQAGKNLRQTQEQVLLKILAANGTTEFLMQKNSVHIKSIEDFQKSFPLAEYEAFRPHFEKQDQQSQWGLITPKPLFYTQTSGSTSQPKLIPILSSTLESYRKTQALWLYHAHLMEPRFTEGKFLVFSGQKVEKVQPSGLEVGATTAHIYASLPSWLTNMYVVPYSIYGVEDSTLKYLSILRLVLSQRDITFVVAANPSTLLKIEELANTHFDSLIQDLERGGFSQLGSLPEAEQAEISERCTVDIERALHLREIKAREGKILLKHLLPNTRLVGCWQGGSCRLAYEKLKKSFAENVQYKDVGYVASEGRMAVPMPHDEGELPSLFEYFFEFQEVDAEGDPKPDVLTMDQLQVGKEYLIIITTPAGLYRYHMNDIIAVTGMHENIPLIKFKRKGSGVTSITGEKLYENQFLEAVSLVNKKYHLHLEMMMIAHEEKSHYIVFCESELSRERLREVEKALDEALCAQNMEYQSKRESLRLGPCQIRCMKKGFFHEFGHQEITLKNIREAQWKLKALNTFTNFVKILPNWQEWQRHE